ncbi:DUF397 domain-containing protein [Actinomadura oligospora]|uniref:DUF397 domain-containing protein n=1 Tax=Actinomadura oligospora TaxID=111804 RepID=UPI00047C7772|nr:DUF397 domain-containing protein [Actinomadura oligospora]
MSEWRKASRSGSEGGDCVELARLHPEVVGVRDSKDPEGPQLGITPAAARGLAEALRAGE